MIFERTACLGQQTNILALQTNTPEVCNYLGPSSYQFSWVSHLDPIFLSPDMDPSLMGPDEHPTLLGQSFGPIFIGS